jgi:hypothetical protein
MEENKNKNQKPIHFLIFKILGCVFAVVAIIGVGLTISGFGNFENNNFMIGGIMTTFGLFLAGGLLVNGFKPEIAKMSTKSVRYIQEENKDDFSKIASTTADITSDAITKTTKAIKNGIKNTKFCKHCGAEIDADSKFCNSCGGEQ